MAKEENGMTVVQIGRPSASRCFGRDELCTSIVRAAVENGTVLLFGCRQAGKSTVLLKIRDILGWQRQAVKREALVIPVYVDLLQLDPEADASGVFKMFLVAALEACERIAGLTKADLSTTFEPPSFVTVDDLTARLAMLLRGLSRSDATFLFLLDEAKRILGLRFSRSFQDNLFSLVYGDHEAAGRLAIVFSGAQELYGFSEDETSPIGSRAVSYVIENLDVDSITALVEDVRGDPKDAMALAPKIMTLTGGQAGLSVRVIARAEEVEEYGKAQILAILRSRHSALFQIWNAAMSKEAGSVQEVLVKQRSLRVEEITQYLISREFDRYRRDRVIDELVFSGLAIRAKEKITVVNESYASFIEEHSSDQPMSKEEQDSWTNIERAELALRKVIRTAYESRWGSKAEERMKEVVGGDAWQRIQTNRSKATKSYRYTSHVPDDDILHYMYFAQLSQLILARIAWDMFSPKFRDKRELEDIVKDISPVRNDSAHFRRTPAREVLRSALRAEDLIHLID